MPNIAVVLSGCGFLDGAEIHESVCVLLNLSRHGAQVSAFAPDAPQAHVVCHLKSHPAHAESRNCLVEAARLTRGSIKPLHALHPEQFDALVLPGGFGVAKNLCDFAFTGANMNVDPDIERVLRGFRDAGKPIGLCCIAPILAARLFPGALLTLGTASEASHAAEHMGARHQESAVDEIVFDDANNLITVPAYMFGDAPIHLVEAGIAKLIDKVLERTAVAAHA